MKYLLAGGLFLLELTGSAHAQNKPAVPIAAMTITPVSLESLLREMTDAGALAKWPTPAYTTHEASSYDRATVAENKPGWWANGDFSQYIRSEEHGGRKEQVMMDAAGPGAIVRFWLTAGAPKKGTLRIYLDGSATPTFTFSDFDLKTGGFSVPPALLYTHEGYSAEMGGSTLYLPIPYAKHCKVTWEEGERPSQRYYQIHYRTYKPGTHVKTITPAQFSATRSLIEKTARALELPPQTVEGHVTSLNQKLAPQKPVILNLPVGPSAVRTLELLLDVGALSPSETERALRSVIIQLTFDGEHTVWCPASDFFGSGVGINELHSLYRTVGRDGTMRCRWLMPYQKSAQVSLVNLGTAPVMVTLHATTNPWQWDAHSMHFHANWHYQAGLKSIPVDRVMHNTEIRDWNFVTIQGRGVYVGDSLTIFNPVQTWYGEGDEKIFVDGEAFPSQIGTGTEDYYGYSYAPRGVFQTPFANHIRIDSPSTQGMNVMSRMRPLDATPFTRSLRFDLELISWRPISPTYAATTYWYGFPGATTNRAPQPKEATLPVQTLAETLALAQAARQSKPGAIEAESLKVVNKSGDFTPAPQDMSGWDETRWSRGQQLLVLAKKVGDFVELEIPAPDNQPHQLVLYPSQAPDYGVLKFAVNGQASKATYDGYAEQVQPGPAVNLGTFTPQNGKYLLHIEVSGSNPKAEKEGTLFGIDFVRLLSP